MSDLMAASGQTAQRSTAAGTDRTGRRPRPRGGSLSAQRNRLFWPFVLPALAFYAVLMLAPTVVTGWISLNRWRAQGDPMEFVGLRNYVTLFTSDTFRTAFWHTLEILVVCGIVIFVLAFAMTVALREMRGRRTARSMLFFPYLISPVVIAIGLGLVLDPTGLLNRALKGAGLSSLAKSWLSPEHIFLTLVVTIIWVSTGFYVLLLMAGVERIPRYYYEDSDLAGASAWQKFRHVTLPLTWDVVTVAAVLWVINAFKIFELIVAFSTLGDAPPLQARTIAVEQYYMTVGGRIPVYAMGRGAAVGVLTLLLVAVCVVVLRRVMRRERVEF
jgi:raffinose/stachyose/melibiose transport system permease protein